MLIDGHPLGVRLPKGRSLAPPLICLVFLSINLIARCSAWTTHQDYDELSGRGSERWSLGPGGRQVWRDKRATGTSTTTRPSTEKPSKSPTTSTKETTISSQPPMRPYESSKISSHDGTNATLPPATSSNSSTKSPSSSTTAPSPSTISTVPSTAPTNKLTPPIPSTHSPTSSVFSPNSSTTAHPSITRPNSPTTTHNSSTTPPSKPTTSSRAPIISSQPLVTTSKPSPTPIKLPPTTLNPPHSSTPVEISLGNTNYEARDVASFLDSHLTHSVRDPRVHFTQSSPLVALMNIRDDASKVPDRSRFAYMMRVFNELGRKVASRINMLYGQLLALLLRAPDGLGTKPPLSAYVDAIREAFTAEADADIVNGGLLATSKPSVASNSSRKSTGGHTISSLIGQDKELAIMFNASKQKVSKILALSLFRLISASNETKAQLFTSPTGPKRMSVLEAALKNGAQTMIQLMNENDKFKPESDAIGHMNDTLNEVMGVLRVVGDEKSSLESEASENMALVDKQRMKLGGLSDSTGLVGPWNTHLFDDLGTSERVVRVFASLLDDIHDKGPKPRFINMYFSQVSQQLNVTMTSFVSLMAMPTNNETSDKFLVDSLDDKTLKKNPAHIMDDISKRHDVDKDRLPARCYLTGRRWRLMLRKAMRDFEGSQSTISMIVDRINQIKAVVTAKSYFSQLDRLCLPRLEVGLKGWGINGEATGETDAMANKFPLRQPIEGLNKDEDPFTSGVRMGYRMGFMIGYNDQRNQSLEMEGRDPAHVKSKTLLGTDLSPEHGQPKRDANSTKVEENDGKKKAEVDYLARASYRRGLTAGAKKALEIGCREGYMSTLKVSVRAGMLLPLEAGASLASLKGSNFARIAGGEAGRNFINTFLMERDHIDEGTRSRLMEVGMAHGSLAGTHIGETVGSIVGHESALEAYRRSISRGGKVTRAKFHLDEYLAGAKVGFDYGVEEGGHVAQTSRTGPHANKFFKLAKPQFFSRVSSAFGHSSKSKTNSTTTKRPNSSRSGLIELPNSPLTISATEAAMADDHWGRNLITPLTDRKIEDFHKARNHVQIKGLFKGTYNVAKEIKRGLQRKSYLNITYDLEVDATGFSMNGITYLSLSGRINNTNVLHGSLIAQNIIGVNKW